MNYLNKKTYSKPRLELLQLRSLNLLNTSSIQEGDIIGDVYDYESVLNYNHD